MYYKIGEVSKMTNLSDQMIRYYEKCGVISPTRSGDGNYRNYTIMDIYALFDAMRYKEWGINIGDINQMVNENYYVTLNENIQKLYKSLKSEIHMKSLLMERIEKYGKKLTLCRYNLMNFWVDMIPAHYLYLSNEAVGDTHKKSNISETMNNFIYSHKNISFFDVRVEFEENYQKWWYAIETRYHDALKTPDEGIFRVVPEQICLCTMIDMGEIGTFDASTSIEPIIHYLKKSGYHQVGPVSGMLIGRGNEQKHYRRIMEIYIPITIKSL
ncbi:MerR family transcriptional regulator [Alkalibacter mobilis]|uniref:MerR family transcriptional regulator n=1 Tax=Alkalibacter mobilis TaxID=2787712 RepID=UPI00189FD790|nr:MerR family DNA-binding transcriptional regulator [Alkalibacter mobilis]MBF7097671.1 MerR family transcriptional regulator [Alkalibacter mobilis]